MEPKFIFTDNVRQFFTMMSMVEKRMGTDSFAAVSGRAGRGKTRTAKYYAVQNSCPYVESKAGWTELWMYQDILEALGIPRGKAPHRKKTAFDLIVDRAVERKAPIFIDEADLVNLHLLESIRDLCKVAMVPFVLIGEESLSNLMNRDRRIWSRRCASLEFSPMSSADIIAFAREGADLGIKGEAAAMIQQATGGDIRLIELVLSTAETIAEANRTKDITCETAEAAIGKVIPEVRR